MTSIALVYRVLRLVIDLETDRYWPPLVLLCARLVEPWPRVRATVEAMSGGEWDLDDRGNPHQWLTYNRQAHTVTTTEDGRQAIVAARERPHLYAEKWRAWITAKRWPTVERPVCESVAIPTGGSRRGGGKLPEGAALADLGRALGVSAEQAASMLLNNKLKLCTRCYRLGRGRCVHPVDNFRRHVAGGRQSWCRSCEAEAKREARR